MLNLIKKQPELKQIATDQNAFYIFLSQSSFIPLDIDNYKVLVKIKSARDKININTLKDANNTIQKERFEIFVDFLQNHNIQSDFAYMVADSMLGVKSDGTYMSDLFSNHAELFRDYIASYRHLKKIIDIYKIQKNDNSIDNVDFKELFSYNADLKTKTDLNFATPAVWQYMLGCSFERAKEISSNAGFYKTLDDIGLSDAQKKRLNRFNYSFFEPIIQIDIKIAREKQTSFLTLEYNLKTDEVSNIDYEI